MKSLFKYLFPLLLCSKSLANYHQNYEDFLSNASLYSEMFESRQFDRYGAHNIFDNSFATALFRQMLTKSVFPSMIVPFPVPIIPNPYRLVNLTRDPPRRRKRTIFYEDTEVIVHLQFAFPYLFPGS